MIFFKKLFLFFVTIFILSSCQSIRDNLSMKKKDSVDEFLIEKKNPLVVPPEFSKLPVPKNQTENLDDDIENKEDLDLSKVLIGTDSTKEKKLSNDLEKSISEILNKR